MTTPMKARRIAREAALWIGGVLGSLCLLSLAAGWALHVTPLVFASGSMSPDYPVGSLGIARQAPATDIRVGDVVSVLTDQGSRVTHRVVAISHQGADATLTLQGDTNDTPDVQTYVVSSAPRVAFDVPYVGYALNAAASPYGVAATAVAVMGLLFLGFGGSGGTPTRRRTRALIPAGVVSVLVVGGVAGASGAAPWAFTSAYWTDSAKATTTASTPTVTVAQPTCTSSEVNPKAQADLAWPSLGSQYEYVWNLYKTTNGNVPIQSGTVAATASGTLHLSFNVISGGGQNDAYTATLQARLVSDHTTLVGSATTTALHAGPRPNGPNWWLYCG